MRLNILTAISRPENLPLMAESIATAAAKTSLDVCWRWRFDLERRNIGGQAVKNELLEQVPSDEWVWVLDDDTLAHEEILRMAEFWMPRCDAVIFGQQRNEREDLVARPENMVVGMCDIGQAFLRRDLIGEHRIPIDYNGDGIFLQTVLAGASVVYHPATVSLHNAISGVEVSV